MGKRLAAAGMAAAIGVGGLTVAALNPFGIAGAQDGSTTTTAPAAPGSTDRAHPDGPLKRALDGLVKDGTLTQAQADKVIAATKAEVEQGMKDRQAKRTESLQGVADAIGVTTDELKAGLKDGKSIAAQAEAKGVPRKTVEDVLTAQMTKRIDDAVAAGHLTEDQATKAKSHIADAVTRILDADGSRLRNMRPGMRFRPGGIRRPGMGN